MEDFGAFLSAEDAQKCGTFRVNDEYSRVKHLLRKAEVSLYINKIVFICYAYISLGHTLLQYLTDLLTLSKIPQWKNKTISFTMWHLL